MITNHFCFGSYLKNYNNEKFKLISSIVQKEIYVYFSLYTIINTL